MNILSILILGALGGILRFPLESIGLYGTLLVNLVGSLALGFLCGISAKKSIPSWIQNGVCAGLIGSFTTFSSFTEDTEKLAMVSLWLAVLYAVLSLAGGIALCFTGERIAKWLVKGHGLQHKSYDNQQKSRQKRRTFTQFFRYNPQTKTSGD